MFLKVEAKGYHTFSGTEPLLISPVQPNSGKLLLDSEEIAFLSIFSGDCPMVVPHARSAKRETT